MMPKFDESTKQVLAKITCKQTFPSFSLLFPDRKFLFLLNAIHYTTEAYTSHANENPKYQY